MRKLPYEKQETPSMKNDKPKKKKAVELTPRMESATLAGLVSGLDGCLYRTQLELEDFNRRMEKIRELQPRHDKELSESQLAKLNNCDSEIATTRTMIGRNRITLEQMYLV